MIAALHIIGAAFGLLVVSTLLYFLGTWIDRKNVARSLEEASIDLATPLSEISAQSFENKLARYLGTKYSDDLLKNRLSDFLGVLLTTFNLFSSLLQLIVLVTVAWFTATEDQGNAVYAWLVLLLPPVVFVIALSVIFVCKLITGRFPGQARRARKLLADRINRSAAQPAA